MYRHIYPTQKKSTGFLQAEALDSDDNEIASSRQPYMNRNKLANAGQHHLTGSAGQAARKSSLIVESTQFSPMQNKLNILQNTPQQLQVHRFNHLHASSSITQPMMHTQQGFGGGLLNSGQ